MSRRVLAVLVGFVLPGLIPAAAFASEGCENEARRLEQHSTYLPDCRAYELVTPPDKNGAGIMRSSRRTQAAASGNAIKFSSLGVFGDARGTGIAVEYLAQRTGAAGTQGWSTHAITPTLDPTSLRSAAILRDPGYMLLSEDLTSGVYRTFTNLTGDRNVEKVQNVYLRKDLLSPGAGSYELVSSCPACTAPLPGAAGQPPTVDDASPDFTRVIFESASSLVAGASEENVQLYEWDRGTLRLAGILPASEGGEAAPLSKAGQGISDDLNTLSDGSDGHSRVFFNTGGRVGPLYMRTDGATTTLLSASERTDCAEHKPCNGTPEPDPSGTQPASYQIASANGERIFFTSSEALTDDAPASNSPHLYMYDASKPDSDPHNLTLIDVSHGAEAGSVKGLMGISSDGSYVYFMDSEQLVAGAPPLGIEVGFFVWHEGTVSYIGASFSGSIARSGGVEELDEIPGNQAGGARVTPDGSHLLFFGGSGDKLTGYDQGQCEGAPCAELYLYGARDGKLVCVSCNPSGASASASASYYADLETGGSGSNELYRSHPLSSDGRRVFFATAESLVPQDTNGKEDVYEYDAATASLHLLTSGTSVADSSFLDASSDGADVFIETAQSLVGWDTDANYDIYDARAGGGAPEPPTPGAPCEGEACHGPQAVSGIAQAPGSALFEGLGNTLRVPVAKSKPKAKITLCRRGFVRRKVKGRARCVKQRKRVARKSTTASKGGK